MKLIALFFGFVFLHILFLKVFGKAKLILRSFFLLSPFLVYLAVSASLVDIWVLLSFWIMYMVSLICSTNSLTLRIMHEISKTPEGELSEQELERKFPQRESLEARLKLMQKSGWLLPGKPDEMILSSKGLLLGTFVSRMRKVFAFKID